MDSCQTDGQMEKHNFDSKLRSLLLHKIVFQSVALFHYLHERNAFYLFIAVHIHFITFRFYRAIIMQARSWLSKFCLS